MHWELPLPEGTSMAVERTTTTDRTPVARLCGHGPGCHPHLNVNGPVLLSAGLGGADKPSTRCTAPAPLSRKTAVGLNVIRLMVRVALGNEKRRQAVLSLSNGCYVGAQMDVVASVDQAVVDGEQRRRGGTGITRRYPRGQGDCSTCPQPAARLGV